MWILWLVNCFFYIVKFHFFSTKTQLDEYERIFFSIKANSLLFFRHFRSSFLSTHIFIRLMKKLEKTLKQPESTVITNNENKVSVSVKFLEVFHSIFYVIDDIQKKYPNKIFCISLARSFIFGISDEKQWQTEWGKKPWLTSQFAASS